MNGGALGFDRFRSDGANLHPIAAYNLHRGLQTLPLRVKAAQANAIGWPNDSSPSCSGAGTLSWP